MGAVATDTGEGLLAAIRAEPDDDALRLIYADYLLDHGDPERAEFISVQIELARMDEAGEGQWPEDGHTCILDPCPVCVLVGRYKGLQRRERELLENGWVSWLASAFHPLAYDVGKTHRGDGTFGISLHEQKGMTGKAGEEIGHFDCFFRCGFIEVIALSWESWLAHESALLTATPLRSVTLLTIPPVRSQWLMDGHGLEFTAAWSPRRVVSAPEVSSRQLYRVSVRQAVLDMLAWRWPDLTFHLPED
jgi:uncharacterized protein (TIGR02996 family)